MKKMIIGIILLFSVLNSCSKSEMSEVTPAIQCDQFSQVENSQIGIQLEEIIDRYTENDYPGMTVLIHTPEDGSVIKSSGFSSLEHRQLLSNCNSFFSGSVAKMYTVSAAMKLYEDGLLNLDAPISTYLPSHVYNNLPNGKTATVRQLMNHSAGMPDHDDEEDLIDYIHDNNGNLPSAEDQLSYLYDNDPKFEAGTNADYSSAHTVVLSLIIDSVNGSHHSNLISSAIIKKLNLTETYYKNETGYPSPSNLVDGYYEEKTKSKNITVESSNYAMGSQGDAGIIATAYDYFLFMKGLFEYKILKESTVNLMINQDWLFDDGDFAFGFGLGLFLMGEKSNLIKVGHSGETLGGMSHVYYYPQHDSYLVVLTNTLIENNEELIIDWAGSTLTNTGSNYLIDKFEALIFN